MTKKKLRLKKEVKYVLYSLIIITLTILFGILIARTTYSMNNAARECDMTKGYTCSCYEIEKFMKGDK